VSGPIAEIVHYAMPSFVERVYFFPIVLTVSGYGIGIDYF
jgi:hypothetical protein